MDPRTRRALALAGAAAAVLGGAAWVVKGSVVILTAGEPPGAFALGMALLPLAVVGLRARAQGGGALVGAGGVAAGVAAAGLALFALGWAAGPAAWRAMDEDTLTPLGVLLALSGLAVLAALGFLGLAGLRGDALPTPLARVAALLGFGTVPLLALSAAVERLHPRLFESPMVLLGAGWMVLGALLARDFGRAPP